MRDKRSKPITREQLRAEVDAWTKRIGARPRRLQIQPMHTKWASCSTSGRITLSHDLLHEEREFRDYVVAHELVHILVPNHGKVFKALMAIYVPGWERVGSDRAAKRCGFER